MAVDDEKFRVMDESSQGSSERSRVSLDGQDHDSDEEAALPPELEDEKSLHYADDSPTQASGAERRQGDQATRSRSKASSSRSRPLSVVPRNKRRGLFGRFAILPEVDRPYDYSNKTKWLITLIIAISGAGAPMGAGIFLRWFLPLLSC